MISITWAKAAGWNLLAATAGGSSAGWPAWLAPSISIGTVIALVVTALRAGEWKGRVDTKIEGFEEAIADLTNEVRRVLGLLPSAAIKGGSPLRLTKLGQDISRELNASSWANNVADDVELRMRGKEPYEVQEFCFDYVRVLNLDVEQQRRVNQSAYDHGLPEEEVRRVMALELRDSLLVRADLNPPD